MADHPRVLLLTEGTYPHAVGGVSSWCDLLLTELREIDWKVLPIVAPHGKPPAFTLPPNAELLKPIEVWTEADLPGRPGRRLPTGAHDVPGILAEHLYGWHGRAEEAVRALVLCRERPDLIRRVFRSRRGWSGFLQALERVLAAQPAGTGPPPVVDVVEAAEAFQTLHWIARCAAVPTPEVDVLHVTAAGWAAVPAAVHRALHGTPCVLTEHGVYVRESYLAAARSADSPGTRFLRTRLARGLSRMAYRHADVVAPVTPANAEWEVGLGVEESKLRVLVNGLGSPKPPVLAPGRRRVVSVGRIDPLKDIHTMLRCAEEVLRKMPDVEFHHYGPVTAGEEVYGASCRILHERLGLGDSFKFMGRTSDARGVVRDADVVLMTSISEGMPMAVLEAMAEARPVVSTGVGGVPDVLRGCGIVTRPGDAEALGMGVVTLLRDPDLADALGRRGHDRLQRVYTQTACVDGYRELLSGRAAAEALQPALNRVTVAA